MASMPAIPANAATEAEPTSARDGASPLASHAGIGDEPAVVVRPRSHKERVRASLAWALDEYANTLAKLAK